MNPDLMLGHALLTALVWVVVAAVAGVRRGARS